MAPLTQCTQGLDVTELQDVEHAPASERARTHGDSDARYSESSVNMQAHATTYTGGTLRRCTMRDKATATATAKPTQMSALRLSMHVKAKRGRGLLFDRGQHRLPPWHPCWKLHCEDGCTTRVRQWHGRHVSPTTCACTCPCASISTCACTCACACTCPSTSTSTSTNASTCTAAAGCGCGCGSEIQDRSRGAVVAVHHHPARIKRVMSSRCGLVGRRRRAWSGGRSSRRRSGSLRGYVEIEQAGRLLAGPGGVVIIHIVIVVIVLVGKHGDWRRGTCAVL